MLCSTVARHVGTDMLRAVPGRPLVGLELSSEVVRLDAACLHCGIFCQAVGRLCGALLSKKSG